jgi:transcriptional regulator with XRE-family HTH domain
MEKQKVIPNNALWTIRNAQNLELKQVASLLGNKTTDSISRYERSISNPNLKTVIKLMLIYNSNLKEMFPDMFECCRKEIDSALRKYNFVISLPKREKVLENIGYCTFEELLDNQNLSEAHKNIIRKHLTNLANKLAYHE